MESGISSARIQLHLDVHQPIELVEMTMSFNALAYEYKGFLMEKARESGRKPKSDDVKLYITKIENNCILAELGSGVAILGHLYSVMDYVNTFKDFSITLQKTIDWFCSIGRSGNVDIDKIELSKAQCSRYSNLLDVVANNSDGRLGINVIEYLDETPESKVHLTVSYSSEEAYEAKKGALICEKALEYRGDADHSKVLMYLYQTNTDEPKESGNTGEKAVISSISKKPLKIYWVSELDQQKISFHKSDADVNPFRCSYIVDVNVEVDRHDNPVFYRVVHLHEIVNSEDSDN